MQEEYRKYNRKVCLVMTKDMTTGKITPLLISFTIPLVLGNLFQLMYNAVDSIIVGKFVGEDALAAVGTSNPLMTLIILFVSGLCMGAGVLISMQYGAKDYEKLELQLSSTLLGGIIFSVLISIISIIAAPALLRIMQTDESIMHIATVYLRIILMGLIFTFIYNFFANALRAMGDSKTPLYFLMISSVFNILGDLFFVVVLHWGSEGCALSTVISEALSSLLCILYIKQKIPVLCLGRRWFRFDKKAFYRTVQYGWTSAMQQATVQLGKLGIQAIVNTMGVAAMAAFAAVNRIDDFAYTPEQNIAHAMTSLLAQNEGAGRKERVREGFRCGMKIEIIYGIIVCIICFVIARPLMLLFVNDEEVVRHGVQYLHLIALMYLLPAATNGIQGYFRGIGDLKVTLWSSFINMGVRVLAAIPLVFVCKLGMAALPFAYLCGWFAMLIAEVPLLVSKLRENKA